MMSVPQLAVFCFAFIVVSGASKIDFSHASHFFNATAKDIFLHEKIGFGTSIHHKDRHGQLAIVNGQAATRGQFCYMVYLQFSNGRSYWSCGGSLVTSNTILTAAHCVQGAVSAVAVLGALDLSQAYETGRTIVRAYKSGLTVHENYDTTNYYNDIGLVKLKTPVKLSQYVCTVGLPSCSGQSSTTGNNVYTISGWGKTSDRTYSSTLMYVNVARESQESCATYYRRYANYNVIQSQLCTSGAGGKSTCNGDSGGPLVQADSTGTFIQQGIVSLGMSSCETSAASVYTDLSDYMSWLCPKLNS